MSVQRRRATLLTVVTVGVLVIAGFLATGLGRDPAAAASPLAGRPAPAFQLEGLNGPAVDLHELRGQVVVLNFWASWCAECRVEQPALEQTWQRFRDSGVVVVGVDFQDQTSDARRYLAETQTSYPVVYDRDSTTSLAYGLRGVPETFLIDQTGQVVDRVIGPVDEHRLAATIKALLPGKSR
jgi:cytochrome c biogenesis protein CcmG, thiol:disulfide interchange protein DsbE